MVDTPKFANFFGSQGKTTNNGFFPSTDPEQQNVAFDIMQRQLLADSLANNAKMPDPAAYGESGPYKVGVKYSPLDYGIRSLSGALSNQQVLQSNKEAMQLQAKQLAGLLGGGGQGGTALGGAGAGLTPQQLMYGAQLSRMYGDEAGKAYFDSIAPTNEVKNAAASGKSNPLDYANALSAGAEASKAPYAPPTAIPDSSGAMHYIPPVQYNQSMGISPQGQSAPFSMGGAAPNLGAIPVMPVQQAPQAAGPVGVQPALASSPALGGDMPTQGLSDMIASPLQKATQNVLQDSAMQVPRPPPADGPALSAAPNPSLTPRQMAASDAASAPYLPNGSAPPVIGQGPSAAQQELTKAVGAGQTEAQKNVQTYRAGLNKKVSSGAEAVRFQNDEEDMANNFVPGAGATKLAKAAAAATRMGLPQDLINKISTGDQSAIGAIQAFTSMQAMHGAEQSLEMMGGGGTGTPRIAASTLESFTKNLADPNQQKNAIKAIGATARQLYQADYAEQQAALADKGDPTTFQERYAQTVVPGLMAGRSADPAQAIQTGDNYPTFSNPNDPTLLKLPKGTPFKIPDGRTMYR